MGENEPGKPPGALVAAGRHGEIGHRRGAGRHVEKAGIRQVGKERPVQQARRLHGKEVRPVDPDEIDRPAAVAPRGAFGDDAVHRLGGVGEPHMIEGDAVFGTHFGREARDEGIGARIAAPGVPPDGLAACRSERPGPGLGASVGSGAGGGPGGGGGGQRKGEGEDKAHRVSPSVSPSGAGGAGQRRGAKAVQPMCQRAATVRAQAAAKP
jgi:hypothetical protein